MWLFLGRGGADSVPKRRFFCSKFASHISASVRWQRLPGRPVLRKKARFLFLLALALPLLCPPPHKKKKLNVCSFYIISWPWKSCTRLHTQDCVSAPAESSTDRRKFLCVFIWVRRNVTRDAPPPIEWCGCFSGVQRAGGIKFSPDVASLLLFDVVGLW